jgi:hypothetical protein
VSASRCARLPPPVTLRAHHAQILEGLHSLSQQLLARYNSDIRPLVPEDRRGVNVEFVLGDAFAKEWTGATLLFANSTCFSDDMMELLGLGSERLPSGTFFITFTKPIPSPSFEVLDSERHDMSWGEATVFIQRKL